MHDAASSTAREGDTTPPANREEWFHDRSAPPITIGGRVLLAGAPAVHASVVLTDGVAREAPPNGESMRRDRVLARMDTDAHGAFAFRAVPRVRGWVRVEAYAGGASPASIWLPGDASKDDVELLPRRV